MQFKNKINKKLLQNPNRKKSFIEQSNMNIRNKYLKQQKELQMFQQDQQGKLNTIYSKQMNQVCYLNHLSPNRDLKGFGINRTNRESKQLVDLYNTI